MKWLKALIAFGAVVILIVVVLLGMNWQARQHMKSDRPLMNIKAVEEGGKTICRIAPDFVLDGDILRVGFTANPQGTYIFSDGTELNQIRVQNQGRIDVQMKMHLGTNLAFFSYVEPTPECWTQYHIRVDLN